MHIASRAANIIHFQSFPKNGHDFNILRSQLKYSLQICGEYMPVSPQ